MKNLRRQDVQTGILWISQLNQFERPERLVGYMNYFPYRLNDRIGDKFKTDNKHINVAAKFSSLPRKRSRANRGENHEGVPRLLPQQLLKDLNHMLNTSIKDSPNLIRISISSMKKSYFKKDP